MLWIQTTSKSVYDDFLFQIRAERIRACVGARRLDQDASTEWNGARPLQHADESWAKLQAELGWRTELPSTGGRSVTVAAVGAVTVVDGEITIMLGPGDHSCQRWRLSPSLADKLEYELATARMRRETKR